MCVHRRHGDNDTNRRRWWRLPWRGMMKQCVPHSWEKYDPCVYRMCVCVCLRYEAMKWRKREWKRNIDLINDILIWMLILIYDYIFYTPVLRLHCLNCSKRKSDVWLFKHRRRTKSAKQFCSMQSIRKQSHLYSPNVLIRHHTMCVSMCVCMCVKVWNYANVHR